MTLKYDSWHKEVLSKFGSMLGGEMAEFHSQVSKVGAASRILGLMVFCFVLFSYFQDRELTETYQIKCLNFFPDLVHGHDSKKQSSLRGV